MTKTAWREKSNATRELIRNHKKGIYDFPRTNWREKSKELRKEIRKTRALYKAAHPDWKAKSTGFRDFVRRHKAYLSYAGSWTKNFKTKSSSLRTQIKSDKKATMLKKAKKILKTNNDTSSTNVN